MGDSGAVAGEESGAEAEGESGQESFAGPLDALSQLQHHQLAVLLDTAMLKVSLRRAPPT